MHNPTKQTQLWQPAPSGKVILPPHEVHIWRAPINIAQEEANQNLSILSPDEKARADRFKFEEHRHHFIAARSSLRKILSRYLAIPPEEIGFTENKHGKPMINMGNLPPFFFNLSHSQDIALYAVSHREEIGIDVEYINPSIDLDGISTRFFSDKESAFIQTSSASNKPEAFFNIWAAKEAFVKALGEGLSFPLKAFDITVEGSTTMLEHIHGDKEAACVWSFYQIEVSPEYKACLAFKSNGLLPTLHYFKFPA